MRACSTGVFEVLSPAVRIKNLHHPLSRTNNCALNLDSEHESRLLKKFGPAGP
jgi:hypothetical protein